MMCARARFVAILCLSIILGTAVASAVNLLRPDSLAGWEYGTPPLAGWTIADGQLSGTAGSTPLLSGFTFGDVELRFRWSLGDGATLKILLPEVPGGDGLELALCEGDGCGRLTDAGNELAAGGKVEPLGENMHTAAVRRNGNKLSVTIDDGQLYEVDVKGDRRFGLGLAVTGGEATVTALRAQEPPGEPIFNGQDLSGWQCRGNLNAWKVENGELVLAGGGGSYLQTEKLFGNFTASMELKMRKGGNSGIGLRTMPEGWPSGDGMELQLLDRPLDEPNHKSSTMAVYGNLPPVGRADKSQQYNRIVIKADGWMLSVWVGGELVQQANTRDHPELKHRHLRGWIGFQDHGAWIRMRDIRVLEAPDGEGLDTWYRPRPPRATTAVIDRFMNPEVLSAADGVRSGVVAKRIADENHREHVLAEFTGPGAIVRVARLGDEGRLAFYFDGEDKPRIECRPGELNRRLPKTTDLSDPMPTCLTYRRGLKIVLRDAKQAQYRFDFLTFPDDYHLESYVDATSGFPRGWLSAANYRAHRFRVGWGGPREHDRLARPQATLEALEPGKTQEVLHVDSAGIVHWWRLNADRKVLEDNDLHLEVTVDGEDRPALAAPVRFLFPGMAGGGNYNNYLWTGRGVLHNALAMPFADGITFALRNAGEKPIRNVGLLLGVEEADKKAAIAGRMRLRGLFLPAADDAAALIDRQGSGRWIGLVIEGPEDQPAGIAELRVDGQPRDGWAADNLDLFLGRGGDFRAALSGRQDRLCWRYMLTAPVDFDKSLTLKAASKHLGDRLAVFYLSK